MYKYFLKHHTIITQELLKDLNTYDAPKVLLNDVFDNKPITVLDYFKYIISSSDIKDLHYYKVGLSHFIDLTDNSQNGYELAKIIIDIAPSLFFRFESVNKCTLPITFFENITIDLNNSYTMLYYYRIAIDSRIKEKQAIDLYNFSVKFKDLKLCKLLARNPDVIKYGKVLNLLKNDYRKSIRKLV